MAQRNVKKVRQENFFTREGLDTDKIPVGKFFLFYRDGPQGGSCFLCDTKKAALTKSDEYETEYPGVTCRIYQNDLALTGGHIAKKARRANI